MPYFRADMLAASITQPVVDFAVRVVGDLGLFGIFILMAPESAFVPIPSEATMMFAGFNVHLGEYSLLAAVSVGVAANVFGSWVAYAIGYYGRLDLIEKHGNKLHVKQEHLDWADRWFERHGPATVFFARMIPVVRTFISLPAGVARMPFWKFTVYTAAGCVPWILGLTVIGREAGDKWHEWEDKLHYVDYAVLAAIVTVIAYFAWQWLARRRAGVDADAGA